MALQLSILTKQGGKVNVVDPIIERIENVKKTGFADMIIVEDHDGQKIEDIQKYGAIYLLLVQTG